MLLTAIISCGAWAVTGFNVAEGYVPLISIQWSTFATFSFFFYVLVVNLQYGGLRTFKVLLGELRYDLHFIFRVARRSKYDRNSGLVDGLRAGLFALCVCTFCTFLFESIWTPLYDGLQFGSLLWPVYYASTGAFTVLERNTLMTFIPLLLAPLIFFAFTIKSIDEKGNPTYSYRIEPRTGATALALASIAGVCWLVWIFFPHQSVPVENVLGPLAKTYSSTACYIYPSQGLFPQNTYTFYPCWTAGAHYPLNVIYGFFDPDNWTHAVNVITKFFTFAAASYPFMVRVKP